MKINYQMSYDDDGFVYRQNIKLSKDVLEKFNDYLLLYKAHNNLDSYERLYLNEIYFTNKVIPLRNSQARLLRRYLEENGYNVKRFLLDRNTKLIVEE